MSCATIDVDELLDEARLYERRALRTWLREGEGTDFARGLWAGETLVYRTVARELRQLARRAVDRAALDADYCDPTYIACIRYSARATRDVHIAA